MIVDDEPDILTSIRIIFEHIGYEVVTVESGEECLQQLEKGFKGVILMDIMMPGLDGWDTIREIIKRDLLKEIAIEIITGKGTMDHNKINGLEAYIDDYIAKPFDTQQLINSVEKCSLALNKKYT
jgi:DNA-binding response OmpR family regulator